MILKTIKLTAAGIAAFILTTATVPVIAQRARTAAPKLKPVVFAVLDDGKTLEPIAFITNGKLSGSEEGQGGLFDGDALKAYFAPKKSYSIVFGGSADGKTVVVKRNTGECSGTSAETISTPVKARLKGFVMALATSAPVTLKAPAFRRLPTPAERSSAESLVRTEFLKQKLSTEAANKIDYHNLTAIDVDRDGKAELVGTFWAVPKENERATLFFIAEQDANGKYAMTLSEVEHYTVEKIMSGDVKDLDQGIYHTLLLDYMDVDGDGVGEIFTTAQAFEGRHFETYKRAEGKWKSVSTSYNYRCGY
ncbi:MAG: hypothetical protein AB7Q37_13630 [Pyrinomonadaceae bacterium]